MFVLEEEKIEKPMLPRICVDDDVVVVVRVYKG
jgi:hypothetical protein